MPPVHAKLRRSPRGARAAEVSGVQWRAPRSEVRGFMHLTLRRFYQTMEHRPGHRAFEYSGFILDDLCGVEKSLRNRERRILNPFGQDRERQRWGCIGQGIREVYAGRGQPPPKTVKRGHLLHEAR